MCVGREQDNLKKSELRKVKKIQWARGVGHRSGCKPLPTIHSGNYVSYTGAKLD